MRNVNGISVSSNNLTAVFATNQNPSEVSSEKKMYWFSVAKSNEKDAGNESGIELSEKVDHFQEISKMSPSELLNKLTAKSFWVKFEELGKLYSIPNIKFNEQPDNIRVLFYYGERQILKEFYIGAREAIDKTDEIDKMKVMLKLIKVMEQLECGLDLSQNYNFPIISKDFITLGLVANLIDLLPKDKQNKVLQHLAKNEECGKVFYYLRRMNLKNDVKKTNFDEKWNKAFKNFNERLNEAFKLFAGESATTPKIAEVAGENATTPKIVEVAGENATTLNPKIAEVLLKIILFSKDTSLTKKYEQPLSNVGNLDLTEIKNEVYGNNPKNQSKSLHLQQEMEKSTSNN